MVALNNVNHFTAGEVAAAIEELGKRSGRGAFRPDELSGLVVEACAKVARENETRADISMNYYTNDERHGRIHG